MTNARTTTTPEGSDRLKSRISRREFVAGTVAAGVTVMQPQWARGTEANSRIELGLVGLGGAVHVFRPRSVGEGLGRSWYPPFNTGSSAYFTLRAGAEMTCQEVRFVPVRFKDAYGPVGAWFLLFKSRATNALGGEYMVERKDELNNWLPYGSVKPIPANLRNYLGMLDMTEGKGPIYMRTEEAIQRIVDESPDEKTKKKKLKELESEAWEDFLDLTISQASRRGSCASWVSREA